MTNDEIRRNDEAPTSNRDIDIFIYGLSKEDKIKKINALAAYLNEHFGFVAGNPKRSELEDDEVQVRRLFRGVPLIAFESDFGSHLFLNGAANPTGFGAPFDVVAALKISWH